MKYSIVSVSGKWHLEQEAEAVHLTSDEEQRHNSICWVRGSFYEPNNSCVSIGLQKKPTELVMETDHTLWIGNYDCLPPECIAWRCKIETNEEVKDGS